MIKPICNRCGNEIGEPGAALAIAPPETPWPWKFHICTQCWQDFLPWLKARPFIVHYLHGGVTSCGMANVPRLWKHHHFWSGDWADVNCLECLKAKP